ncbi:hypothetical protein [Luteibacter jiangsuensis]
MLTGGEWFQTTLRNIAFAAPYFHSGKVWDLRQAIAIMGRSQLDQTLTDDEIGKIETFQGTLTGPPPAVMLSVRPPSVATPSRPMP